ncbi:alpha/beta hydrolase [Nocardiopsis ansamitocini]|uniref:Serine aminopeptidase S33 domain-containing protein n=1 Tax=Nocardiopsis ansamitocini TaxID=1670832 RepID=A0A9W6UIW8_9ACTN|nr:alpha/beta fold hydrolase [Nocardiopsis ansamitocini]GLU48184.1 hypothetical protein Nans01_25350 [Nocardiopsis ansamitocini]
MAEWTWAVGADGPWVSADGAPGRARGVVLLLHGGEVVDDSATGTWDASVLRMLPFGWALRNWGAARGLAVWRVRFRVRGWNGRRADPTHDVAVVMEEVRRLHGDVPVILMGHSMGGRAALLRAGDPGVRGVLGLAPWIEPGDPVEGVRGRHLLIAHAAGDVHTSARESRRFVERARGPAASADFVGVALDAHPMLRVRRWNEVAVAFAAGVLGWA